MPKNGEAPLSDDRQPIIQPRHKRRFIRYPFDVRIQVSLFRAGETNSLWGRTSELAEDGVGATLTGELQTGEVVWLEFSIPIAPHIIKLRAIVRYCEGLHSGFEFLVMTEAQKTTLRQVCVVLANAT